MPLDIHTPFGAYQYPDEDLHSKGGAAANYTPPPPPTTAFEGHIRAIIIADTTLTYAQKSKIDAICDGLANP